MKLKRADVEEMAAEIERESVRSSLFWDLYENHAALVSARGIGRFRWKELTVRLVARGLTDANGNPPHWRTAKKTWNRVCQLKEREQAVRDKKQRARAREPERGKNADRPPLVVTTPAPTPPAPRYSPPPMSTPQTPPAQSALHSRPDASPNAGGSKQTPEEMLADLKATIKRRNQYF